MVRLLLVEDDPDLARGLRFNLEHEGFVITHAENGARARAELAKGAHDLVVLDLGLPDVDGLDLLRELRKSRSDLPVICLTARAQETDVVMGLGLGADDYVTKPFGLAALIARIQAVLRRSGKLVSERLVLGDVVIDMASRKVKHPDREEELTPIELDLLRYLLARRGQAVERERLLADLWGLDPTYGTRTLDNHMARLRRKIERDASTPRCIVTVHRVGYRLENEATS